MSFPTSSLTIKDGLGVITSLSMFSGSDGLIPVHGITSSTSEPIYVDQVRKSTIYARVSASVSNGIINWATPNSGTFVVAGTDSSRRGLIITNDNPANMYIAIGNANANNLNGFHIENTASAPIDFSFILYPSGTYIADQDFVCAQHSVYFVSSSQNLKVFATLLQ